MKTYVHLWQYLPHLVLE
jgi:hypothetical protein